MNELSSSQSRYPIKGSFSIVRLVHGPRLFRRLCESFFRVSVSASDWLRRFLISHKRGEKQFLSFFESSWVNNFDLKHARAALRQSIFTDDDAPKKSPHSFFEAIDINWQFGNASDQNQQRKPKVYLKWAIKQKKCTNDAYLRLAKDKMASFRIQFTEEGGVTWHAPFGFLRPGQMSSICSVVPARCPEKETRQNSLIANDKEEDK